MEIVHPALLKAGVVVDVDSSNGKTATDKACARETMGGVLCTLGGHTETGGMSSDLCIPYCTAHRDQVSRVLAHIRTQCMRRNSARCVCGDVLSDASPPWIPDVRASGGYFFLNPYTAPRTPYVVVCNADGTPFACTGIKGRMVRSLNAHLDATREDMLARFDGCKECTSGIVPQRAVDYFADVLDVYKTVLGQTGGLGGSVTLYVPGEGDSAGTPVVKRIIGTLHVVFNRVYLDYEARLDKNNDLMGLFMDTPPFNGTPVLLVEFVSLYMMRPIALRSEDAGVLEIMVRSKPLHPNPTP